MRLHVANRTSRLCINDEDPMTQSAALAALRQRHLAFDALPDTIAIPALELRHRAIAAISDEGGR
ncbi:MAG TPA: hypothetical protein VH397_03015 [Xanthobacteraceae bacterium]|jgi:hypothetical protein